MDRAGIRRRGSRWWWLNLYVRVSSEQVGVSRANGNGGGTRREREKRYKERGADGARLIFPSLFWIVSSLLMERLVSSFFLPSHLSMRVCLYSLSLFFFSFCHVFFFQDRSPQQGATLGEDHR